METKKLPFGPNERIFKIHFYDKRKIYITIIGNTMYAKTLIGDTWNIIEERFGIQEKLDELYSTKVSTEKALVLMMQNIINQLSKESNEKISENKSVRKTH